jgi:hypothetical protein
VSRTIKIAYVDQETGERMDARGCLRVVTNHWLYAREIETARRVACHGTDEECETLLAELERQASNRLAAWRWSQ